MIGAWLLWLFTVTAYDFGRRRVPNWLMLLGAGVALLALVSGLQPFGLGWADAFTGCAVAFSCMLVFYVGGWMGAGDVKFAAALGLWVGLKALLAIWLMASLMAALHAITLLVLRRWPLLPRLALALSGPARAGSAQGLKAKPIPYAAYLAISSLGWAAWV